MTGILTCQHHRDQIARGFDRLPGLYAELAGYLAPYRSPQAPKGDGGRTAETPDVLSPPVFECRKQIERKFWEWSAYVATARKFTMPAPTVKALGGFLENSVEWLCNDRLAAPAVGARLAELLAEAVHLRNRGRASGLFLGSCPVPQPVIHTDGRVAHEPCGGSIRYDRQEARADPTYQVTCPRCGTADSLLWWQRQIVGNVQPPTLLPAVPLAMFLADSLAPELAAAGRKITPSTIGKWKFDGYIAAVACDPKSRRDLFDRTDVEAVARDRYKLNPPEGRTA
jgi:hypothetical protein